MNIRERDLKLFHSDPPRMYPNVPHQRPKIEGMLAQLAATDPVRYEERFGAYNKMCAETGVALFARLTVTKEETPAETLPETIAEKNELISEAPAVEVPTAEDVKAAREKVVRKMTTPLLDAELKRLNLPIEGKNKNKVAAILAAEFPETI